MIEDVGTSIIRKGGAGHLGTVRRRSHPPVNGLIAWRNAWAVVAAGTCATRRHSPWAILQGVGLPDYLGWQGNRRSDSCRLCSGCRYGQTAWKRCCICYMAAGHAPMIPLDEALRPGRLWDTVHEGCDHGGFYEQAQFAEEYGLPLHILRDWDARGQWCSAMWGKEAGWAGSAAVPTSEVRDGCHARFPDKFMPFMNHRRVRCCLQRRFRPMDVRFTLCAGYAIVAEQRAERASRRVRPA